MVLDMKQGWNPCLTTNPQSTCKYGIGSVFVTLQVKNQDLIHFNSFFLLKISFLNGLCSVFLTPEMMDNVL